MPNKFTFKIPVLLDITVKYKQSGFWVDPFAGWHSPAELTNDLNPEAPTTFHMEALDLL